MNLIATVFRNILGPAVLITGAAVSLSAATFTVTNTNDSGAGSLRQAILDANAAAGGDVINFDASFNVPRTITLASLITVTGNGGLTINGTGADLLTISGNNAVRVFEITGLNSPLIGPIVFNDLTIANGLSTPSGAGMGGGIGVNNNATGTLTAVTFTANNIVFRGNRGGVNAGGAIGCTNGSTVNVNNSIFTGSSANGGGAIDATLSCSVNVNNSSFYENIRTGGDYTFSSSGTTSINNSAFYNNGSLGGDFTILFRGLNKSITNTTITNNIGTTGALGYFVNNLDVSLTLTNVTIAGNYSSTSNNAGGLVTSNINVVNIGNSIIANNSNPAGGSDIEIGVNTNFISQGYNLFENIGTSVIGGNTTGNLIGIDPRLDTMLRDNGGPTKTIALRPGSPAVDTGNPTTFPPTDQRGIARPQDGDGVGGARSDIGAYEGRLTDLVSAAPFDFNRDGRADLGVFRPSNAVWYLRYSTTNQFYATRFGLANDKLAPADYDGDGRTDIAVWREDPSNPDKANFYIMRSSDGTFRAEQFGRTGDDPSVVGDWDGDLLADLALYRDGVGGSQSFFFYRPSSQPGTGFISIPWGFTGDKPARGDFDGDGKSDAAVFRPASGTWFIRQSSDLRTRYERWGIASDKLAPADYDGDGATDVAVFRDGVWYIQQSLVGQPRYERFGIATDILVPADYDGDGRADVAVYRDGIWYLNQSTAGFAAFNFGLATDIPLPGADN